MRLGCFLVLSVFSIGEIFSQNISAEITTWKNDAKGAYSIVHDDYGLSGADGIWQYADTIAYNRGIKFVFGAYTYLCESRGVSPNGYDDLYDYAKTVMIDIHGHEIANHSYEHTSAVDLSWTPAGSGWGETPIDTDMDKEIDQAHQSIIDGTGITPKYYVYPYDQFTNAANIRLEELGYIGSRTGWSGGSPDDANDGYHVYNYENSDVSTFYPNERGFFRNGVEVFNDSDAQLSWEDQLEELNNEIDNVISNNLYANREFHNVGNSGWGHVKIDAYRGHMDYLQEKVEAGDLWVGTCSEIFTYQIQKLNYSLRTVALDDYHAVVIFNNESDIDIGEYLDPLFVKSPVTIKVDLSDYNDLSNVVVIQKGDTLNHQLSSKTLMIDAYPHEGTLSIHNLDGITITGNNEELLSSSVKVSPNPFSNNGFKVTSDIGVIKRITAYNSLGEFIETSEETLLGAEWDTGTYFLNVELIDGQKTRLKVQKL